MAYDPKDYDGITYESEAREERERAEAQAQEDQEREDREMAFVETAHCSAECFAGSLHTAHCQAWSSSAVAAPVARTANDWLRAMQAPAPRYAAIGNGLFVRVGGGKKKRRAA